MAWSLVVAGGDRVARQLDLADLAVEARRAPVSGVDDAELEPVEHGRPGSGEPTAPSRPASTGAA